MSQEIAPPYKHLARASKRILWGLTDITENVCEQTFLLLLYIFLVVVPVKFLSLRFIT
jgi:hypothetical protein